MPTVPIWHRQWVGGGPEVPSKCAFIDEERFDFQPECPCPRCDSMALRMIGPRLQRKLATTMLSKGGKQIEGNLREFAAMVEADRADGQRSSEAPEVELTADAIRRAA